MLKCSKNSASFREAVPVKAAFENEILLYSRIVPCFQQFQRKKGVDVFDSVSRYFGSYTSNNKEVIVLENLKNRGYYLADRKLPLPSDHLELILEEYGKWHGISAAMQDQNCEEFNILVREIRNVWEMFAEQTDVESFFGAPIEETYELVKSSLSRDAAEKLRNFKSQVMNIIGKINDNSRFSVITHGDCWNNNFMFKSEVNNGEKSLKVAMLDWQTIKYANPVMDISYFIYACASQEDLGNFDHLLECYYGSFVDQVRRLGSDPARIYSFSQLREDFKIFGKYGVMLTTLAVKVALSDKEEAPDFAESSDDGGFENTFSFRNRDQSLLRSRMLYVIKHITEQDIL